MTKDDDGQRGLFDEPTTVVVASATVQTGTSLKDAGMQRAIENADEDWATAFRRTVRELAARGRPFTSEEVTSRVGLPRGRIATNANNAVGALMNAMARLGVIQKTGKRVRSLVASSHAAELAEWIGRGKRVEDEEI